MNSSASEPPLSNKCVIWQLKIIWLVNISVYGFYGQKKMKVNAFCNSFFFPCGWSNEILASRQCSYWTALVAERSQRERETSFKGRQNEMSYCQTPPSVANIVISPNLSSCALMCISGWQDLPVFLSFPPSGVSQYPGGISLGSLRSIKTWSGKSCIMWRRQCLFDADSSA